MPPSTLCLRDFPKLEKHASRSCDCWGARRFSFWILERQSPPFWPRPPPEFPGGRRGTGKLLPGLRGARCSQCVCLLDSIDRPRSVWARWGPRTPSGPPPLCAPSPSLKGFPRFPVTVNVCVHATSTESSSCCKEPLAKSASTAYSWPLEAAAP